MGNCTHDSMHIIKIVWPSYIVMICFCINMLLWSKKWSRVNQPQLRSSLKEFYLLQERINLQCVSCIFKPKTFSYFNFFYIFLSDKDINYYEFYRVSNGVQHLSFDRLKIEYFSNSYLINIISCKIILRDTL